MIPDPSPDDPRQQVTEHRRGAYLVTSDPSAVDVDAVHEFLRQSYWAVGIPRDVVARAIANSLSFSLLEAAQQIGFARVVTDRATYGYLADVYVLEHHRGKGLGRWLIECVMSHPGLCGVRRLGLVTRDAHALYAQLGFTSLAAPDRHMEMHRPDLYASVPDCSSRT